jgi:3-dehydroquinate dehydratase II
MATNLLLLNGLKLNLLGTREREVYESTMLDDIEQAAKAQATDAGATITSFQDNYENALIDHIHPVPAKHIDTIVMHPAGLSDTSAALRNALAGTMIPFVEVAISSVHRRGVFRYKSFLSDVAVGVICGPGAARPPAAIDFALKKL